ncbi:glycosyltransferase [Belliella sp. R4-6]|uniref:Glycosyltransferase n=1 Tax=Belliella alkalica TaxID=1730871 RepID=A0ABS9VDW2_9BACT|nr:glycosyltransferase [Belliella alkalica]MCH7414626.1 glycosyltransferase [Belliella alkalica]
MSRFAPICLFTYNRLSETISTIEALRKNYLAKESDLIIFSDGPKNILSERKINDVREYINKVEGFKSVKIFESKINKGLANSIIEGVSNVVGQYGKIIVLEDDLVTSPNFLDFMNQALQYYENDSEIISVSGYTLNLPSLPRNRDFYYGYRASSWGWGIWKDRWEQIDWEMSNYEVFLKDKKLVKNFLRGGSDMLRMLKNQREGRIDSWAIRLCFHQSLLNLKTVFPSRSKIESIGYSKEATHTVGAKRFLTILDKSNQRDFQFSHFQEVDENLVNEFKQKFSILNRLKDKINNLLTNAF